MRSFKLTPFVVVFAARLILESIGLPVGEDDSCEVSYRGQCVDQINYNLHRNQISEIRSVVIYKELNGKKATIGHCDWVEYFSCEAVQGYMWIQTDSTFCVRVNSSTTCANATFSIAVNGQKIVLCEAAQTHNKTRGPDDGSKQISKNVAKNCQDKIPEDTDTKSDDHKNAIITGISCVLAAICLVDFVVGVYIIRRKRRNKRNTETQHNAEEEPCMTKESQSVHQNGSSTTHSPPPPGKKTKLSCFSPMP